MAAPDKPTAIKTAPRNLLEQEGVDPRMDTASTGSTGVVQDWTALDTSSTNATVTYSIDSESQKITVAGATGGSEAAVQVQNLPVNVGKKYSLETECRVANLSSTDIFGRQFLIYRGSSGNVTQSFSKKFRSTDFSRISHSFVAPTDTATLEVRLELTVIASTGAKSGDVWFRDAQVWKDDGSEIETDAFTVIGMDETSAEHRNNLYIREQGSTVWNLDRTLSAGEEFRHTFRDLTAGNTYEVAGSAIDSASTGEESALTDPITVTLQSPSSPSGAEAANLADPIVLPEPVWGCVLDLPTVSQMWNKEIQRAEGDLSGNPSTSTKVIIDAIPADRNRYVDAGAVEPLDTSKTYVYRYRLNRVGADPGTWSAWSDERSPTDLTGQGHIPTTAEAVKFGGAPAGKDTLTKTVRVPATEFVPEDETTNWTYGVDFIQPGTTGADQLFFAPLVLPEGAVITNIRIRSLRKTSSDTVELELWKQDDDLSLGSPEATVSNDSTSTSYVTDEATGLSVTVEGNTVALKLTLHANTSSGDASVTFVEVDYTVTDVTQSV